MDISTLAAAKVLCGGGGGGATNAVKYTEQTLTEEQQMQARKNLGLYYEHGESVVIEWDGGTTGRATIDAGGMLFYKVSDNVLSASDFACATMTTSDGGSSKIPPEYILELADGFVLAGNFILSARAGVYDIGISITVPEDGVYSAMEEGMYVTRLEIVHETVSKIDKKFIPIGLPDLAEKDIDSLNYVQNKPYDMIYNKRIEDVDCRMIVYDSYDSEAVDILYNFGDEVEFALNRYLCKLSFSINISDEEDPDKQPYISTTVYLKPYLPYGGDQCYTFFPCLNDNRAQFKIGIDILNKYVYLKVKHVNHYGRCVYNVVGNVEICFYKEGSTANALDDIVEEKLIENNLLSKDFDVIRLTYDNGHISNNGSLFTYYSNYVNLKNGIVVTNENFNDYYLNLVRTNYKYNIYAGFFERANENREHIAGFLVVELPGYSNDDRTTINSKFYPLLEESEIDAKILAVVNNALENNVN